MRVVLVGVLTLGLVIGSVAVASPGSADTPALQTTATSLTITPIAGVHVGAPVTLTTSISPVTATGAVTFTRDGQPVGAKQIANGAAVLVVPATAGVHTFVAAFTATPASEGGVYQDSQSPPTSLTVIAPAAVLPLRAGAYGPLVTLVQRRLTSIGVVVSATSSYDAATVAAVKRFQSKFALSANAVVDARTWTLLRTLTARSALSRKCIVRGRVICIDKTLRILRLVINGKIVMSLDARFGGPHHVTREGVFAVYKRYVSHISSDYHTRMPFSLFFSGAEAVHYSDGFAAEGYHGYSHGCVNLRDWAAARALFIRAPIRTRVVVYH